jgi:catalase
MTDQENPITTTDAGIPAVSDEYSLSVGPDGPLLMQDHYVIQKMAQFNRERVPERVVHAKGSGAFGYFEVTADATPWTKAAFLNTVGKRTPVLARFSTVAGEQGSADTARDPRGFALKFYTEEGNWDLVGNNTPVFFIRDPLKFPDLNRAVKRDPRTGMRSADNNWDYWTLLPEALHQVTIVMSERGIPRTFRHMHGFGSHTYSFLNAKNERFWVKFTFKTQQGIQNLTDEEARNLIGDDRESHQRDLFESIERSEFPRWTLYVQIMQEAEANSNHLNPFDLTKVWPHGDYPLIEVGVVELNRNPENFFQDVEQAAFSPATIVPGISFSPDKMLQGRLFSYGDTQRYRLGVNHSQIPVNAPQCPFHSYHRDGAMRVDGNGGRSTNYEPNSKSALQAQPDYSEPPLQIEGAAGRWNHREDTDYFSQPRNLFRMMTPAQQQVLFENTARAIKGASQPIVERHIANCTKADPAYGKGVSDAIARLG